MKISFKGSETTNTGSVHYTPWCSLLTSSGLLCSSYCYLVAVGVQQTVFIYVDTSSALLQKLRAVKIFNPEYIILTTFCTYVSHKIHPHL